MAHYLCASKEINGGIYITRLSIPSISSPSGQPQPGLAPGTDDGIWYFVGPGSRPSIQHYNGTTQFILTFDFLSHLTARVIDISTWPPTIINPIQSGVSGGPNTTNQWTPNTLYLTGSQVVDPNFHVQRATAGGVSTVGFTLGNIQITGNVLTVIVTNTFTPGQVVAFGNMLTAKFLNGVEVIVGTSNGLQFTASFTHANYPSTPDTGNVAVIPAWNDSGGSTPDNQITWGDQGTRQPFATTLSSVSDAIAVQLKGNTEDASVDNFFNPPAIDRSLLFLNGLLAQYSVTLSLDPNWVPFLKPAGTTAFYRLYRRAIGTLPWIRIMDWTPTTFSFTDTAPSNVPFRFEYSATWGDNFDPTDPNNLAKHAEGIPGGYIVSVDSTIEHPSTQLQLVDFIELDFESTMEYASFDQRQEFVVLAPFDLISFPVSSVGRFGEHPSNGMEYATFGDRQAFVVTSASDQISAPFSSGPNALSGSMSAPANMS